MTSLTNPEPEKQEEETKTETEEKEETTLEKLDKNPRYLSLIPKFLGDGRGGKIFQGWVVYLGNNLLLGEKHAYKKVEDAIKEAMKVVMLP